MKHVLITGIANPLSKPLAQYDILIGKPGSDHSYHAYLKPDPSSIETDATCQDLLSVAAGLMRLEGIIGKAGLREDFDLTLSLQDPDAWSDTGALDVLGDVMKFAIRVQPRIRVVEAKPLADHASTGTAGRRNSVTLFSGGVDSYAGIHASRSAFGDTAGCFVSHSSGTPGIVRHLVENYLSQNGISVYTFKMSRTPRLVQQLRGFTYLLAGSSAALSLKSNNLVISECGVTMYQPPLLPNDLVTLTTHPHIVLQTKELVRRLLGSSPSYVEPFEDMTKAEIISSCAHPKGLAATHSCRNTQFANASLSQCGKCYGCLIKQTGLVVAGLEPVASAWNPLSNDIGTVSGWNQSTGWVLKIKDMLELLQLLRFSRDILEEKLSPWSLSSIETFGKTELFNRFALDVLASLKILYGERGGGKNSLVYRWYKDAVPSVVSEVELDERIHVVREMRKKPNFDFSY